MNNPFELHPTVVIKKGIDRIVRLGMPDRLVAHATRAQQLAEVGLDPAGIARSTRDALRCASRPALLGAAVSAR